MDPAIKNLYGSRVRVRICGLCWQDDRLLMINHGGLTQGDFWAPAGGGLEFQESVEECLCREFLEETGLHIVPGNFRFACEFRKDPLHAIELFFDVSISGGGLQQGDDPELSIIREARFMPPSMIAALPDSDRHGIFGLVPSSEDLKTLTGFFRI